MMAKINKAEDYQDYTSTYLQYMNDFSKDSENGYFSAIPMLIEEGGI